MCGRLAGPGLHGDGYAEGPVHRPPEEAHRPAQRPRRRCRHCRACPDCRVRAGRPPPRRRRRAPGTSASSPAGSPTAAPTTSPAATSGTAPATGSPAATTPTGGTGSAEPTARGCDVRRSGGVLDVDCPSTGTGKSASDGQSGGGKGPQRNYGGATPVAPPTAEPSAWPGAEHRRTGQHARRGHRHRVPARQCGRDRRPGTRQHRTPGPTPPFCSSAESA
ncbi:hypothetical protein ACU686_06845 [Yinghuangia aomiensis]